MKRCQDDGSFEPSSASLSEDTRNLSGPTGKDDARLFKRRHIAKWRPDGQQETVKQNVGDRDRRLITKAKGLTQSSQRVIWRER
ncbi:MAG: hypothetical protein E6K68_00880 [Nitrospirae bacterium]|nr:MAG: hypothetical protein E6K68_00880 [Nitrospirota bacterium]